MTTSHLAAIVLAVSTSRPILGARSGDRNPDSNRTLVINGGTHIYPTDTAPAGYPGTKFIHGLGPSDQVKVQQVVYRSGSLALKVRAARWTPSGLVVEW